MEIREYKLRFITELLGTVPKDPEIYASYIATKNPNGIDESEVVDVESIEQKGWTGFMKDENGLYVFEYMHKGFLKHAGNVLKESLKLKNLASKIDDYVFVSPRKIYLGKMEPDGVLERPLRAMTRLGPRVTLARSDYVNPGTEVTVNICLLPHKDIKWETIEILHEYGKLSGWGQFRNGGYGRFEVLVK